MILRKGEMFDSLLFCDVLIVTGNSTLKSNGAVVMGRGAAMQMRDRFKDIDKEFGALIKQSP